jgi:ribosomal protein L12E/L44/L45/RPP1/RPP2
MDIKIIKIYEEAINEILVAATDSETDAEATDPEEEEEEEEGEEEEEDDDDDERQQQQQ